MFKGCKHSQVPNSSWSENQRERIHHGVQAKSAAVDVGGCRAELSFCFSMAKSSCIANQWEQEIRLNAQERGIRDLQILPSTSVLELGEPDVGEAGENKKCVWPRVLCQTWLLDAAAAAEHLSAEMTPLCSLAGYLKSNRCGLIGMRSPPRGWQKSVTGSIPVGVGDCRNWFSFCLLFSRSFSLQLSCPFLYFALVKEKKTNLPESLYATAMAEVIFWTICTACTYILLVVFGCCLF